VLGRRSIDHLCVLSARSMAEGGLVRWVYGEANLLFLARIGERTLVDGDDVCRNRCGTTVRGTKDWADKGWKLFDLLRLADICCLGPRG